jgi:penicillin amidase
MARRIARAQAPGALDWAIHRELNPLISHASVGGHRVSQIVALVRDQPAEWFPRPWPQELAEALAGAVRTLQDEFGPQPAQWAWGRVRTLTFTHPFGERRPLHRVFNRGPFPCGGDGGTISQAGVALTDPTRNPGVVANLRMVVDVGNWDESHFVLAGGQSGNPLSPHYADLLELWLRGEGIPIPWSEKAVASAARTTLQLRPS